LVEGIFNKIHNIKGNASLLQLQSVVNNASEVEDKLSKLRGKKNFKGDELLTSIVGLAELRDLLEEFRDIRSTTLNNFKPQNNSKPLSITERLVADLNRFSEKIGSEHNKVVIMEANSLDLDGLDKNQFQNAKDLLIQLVRNSIVHGIETPEERTQNMKWSEGTINLKSILDESSTPCYTLSYRDDGRGLDPKTIGKRAVELEMITEEEYTMMNNQQLSALIFNHGFSSVDVSDDHAGRGTGMELIRDIVRNKMGGKLRMTYQTGDHLEFAISFPKEALSSDKEFDQEIFQEVI